MSDEQFRIRTANLKNIVFNDMNNDISSDQCNIHVSNMESLKSDLYDDGYDWIEDLNNIEYVDEGGVSSDGSGNENIRRTLEEVHYQLERIIDYLKVDSTKKTPPKIRVAINKKKTQKVNKNPEVNVQPQIDELVKQYQNEFEKIIPDPDNKNKILDKLRTLGPIGISAVKKLMKKYLRK